MDPNGKVAIVTGGAQGIGKGIAMRFLREGMKVVIAETLDQFDGIDVLVSNAGTMLRKPMAEVSLEEWNRVLATNLTGAFLSAKHAAPHLARRSGSIVNIASTRAHQSEKNTEAYAATKGGLVALTHALAISLGPDVRVNAISPGWIEVSDWKKRSARQIPRHSKEDEEQHPAGRVGRPEDVAELVMYLVSPASGFMTGAELVLDGGMTKKMIYAE